MEIRKLTLAAMLVVGGILAVGSEGCPKKPPKTTPTPAVSETPTPTPDLDAEMKGQTTPTPEPTNPPGCDFKALHFDLDSSTLTGDNLQAAKDEAACLVAHADWKVTVEGHADERGGTQYNLALGERRARAVADFLINAGVAKTRVDTVSFGEERPVSKGHDESAWSQNRRAELKVRK
jgi:peptidoglycan-associated lipoprotein